MPPAAFLHPQNAPKSLTAPDPTGGDYSAPQIPSWIKGPTSKRRERGVEGEGKEGFWTLTMF